MTDNRAPETLESLRQDRERYVAFAFATADILIEIDQNGTIVYADGGIRALLGREAQTLIGLNFYDLVRKQDIELMQNSLGTLQAKHRMEHVEIHVHTIHRDAMPFMAGGFRISHVRNHTFITLATPKGNITADQLFQRDYDTGLLNVQGYVDTANRKILEAQSKGDDVTITLLDFPQLKDLIDELPEDAAAQLLNDISGYLRENSLDGDTAGMIGDGAYSFVHDSTVETAKVVGDLLAITQKYAPAGKQMEVRSETIEADATKLSAMDSANVLLYTLNDFSKSKGEGFTIESLSEGYEKMLNETVTKMNQFKQTISDEDFKIAFQPIVDLKSGLIHHYEALVRLNTSGAFSNPFDFITFGEQAGVIGDFDLLLTNKVLEVLERTSKNGNFPLVAVNLSGRSLSSSLFKDAMRKLINQYTRRRKQLIIEITESSKIDNLEEANKFIQELREAGNLCCLDDFGAGESSFEYLRSLQVDFIKIDGSYVRESLKTQRGRHMLKAMSGLCRDLNITTIGEMVEDEKAAKLLWEAGVKFGQGYLFGKPDVDEETIMNCKKPTPFYGGMMRIRSFNQKKAY